MTRKTGALVYLMVLGLAWKLSPVISASEADDLMIDGVMAKLQSSFLAGEPSYAVDVMYTPVVDAMGGKATAIAAANTMAADMRTGNVRFISFRSKKPYRYASGEIRQYVVVPIEMIMLINGKKMTHEGYELGIRVPSATWQFLAGDSITPAVYSRFFPDFPKTVVLPEVKTLQE